MAELEQVGVPAPAMQKLDVGKLQAVLLPAFEQRPDALATVNVTLPLPVLVLVQHAWMLAHG